MLHRGGRPEGEPPGQKNSPLTGRSRELWFPPSIPELALGVSVRVICSLDCPGFVPSSHPVTSGLELLLALLVGLAVVGWIVELFHSPCFCLRVHSSSTISGTGTNARPEEVQLFGEPADGHVRGHQEQRLAPVSPPTSEHGSGTRLQRELQSRD